MKRRALLSAVLGGTVVTSGCLGVVGGRSGEGTTVEIIPTNLTDERISLDVAVYASGGVSLLDHSFSLPPDHTDQSQGVEDRVDHLLVSLNGRSQVRHDYAPDVDNCSRDGEDVHILVEPDGIEFTYSC